MSCVKEWCIRLLEEHRGLIVLVFCLPLSFVFDCFLTVYFFARKLFDKRDHESKVKDIQAKIHYWNKLPQNCKKLLCTARPNWLSLSTTFYQKDKCYKIAIDLYDILSFDEKNLRVKVEPLVTIGEITKYLLPKGYILAAHLEIAEATLGGLAMGVGMTTHSHKVGLYQETIVSYDVLLSNGKLVHATQDNMHSDLYKALPWSHGTLGFLVALELEVIPAKPFIHMRYIPVQGQKRYCSLMRKLSGAYDKDEPTPDFLEAIIYSKDEAVILAGSFSNEAKHLKVNPVKKWYKPWFYKYVETALKTGTSEELIPIEDYLLRHNRSIFWVMESMLYFGNNKLFRLLFGWLLPPKIAFLKFTTTQGIRRLTFTKQVFQDIVLPMSCLEDQINLAEELFDLYPLLVYPCRVYDRGEGSGQVPRPNSTSLCPGTDYAIYNDLGIYGVPGSVKRKSPYNATKAMRKMEKFTREVGGFSFLYADIFMDREEFEQMFDLKLYEEVRKKYSAEDAFPHLYDKVKPEIDVIAIGEN